MAMAFTREELYQRLLERCLIRDKDIRLSSGIISNVYFDKYQFESDPLLIDAVTDFMIELIPVNTNLLGAMELGAIPICTLLSHKTKIPMVLIRKKAKEYGTYKLIEGPDIKGKNICVIEDVITTGRQVIESCKEIRNLNGIVENVICVLLREENALINFNQCGIKLKSLFCSFAQRISI